MKSYKTIILLPLVAVISNPVMAHNDHDGHANFDQRIERQQKRIKKGVRNDQLTKKEVKKLRKQHRHIKKLNQQFKKDGYLNHHERKILRQKLDLASKRIYRLKHNRHYRDMDLHRHASIQKKHYAHSSRHRDHKHDRSLASGSRHNY